MDTHGDYKRAILELLRQRLEPINQELSIKNYLEPSESPKKIRRTVQWKETNLNNPDMKQLIQFDRNNQAKSATLSTINTRPSGSQYLEQRSYSNENYDE
jgi:hypothetical protein